MSEDVITLYDTKSTVVDERAEDFVGTERFLVQRRLGSGAFGVVYEAFDRQAHDLVALKVLRDAEADSLYRFKKGFRSLADIRHPNLVSFYELFTEGGVWFFSMELVPGVDFIHYLTGVASDALSTSTGALPEHSRREPVAQSGLASPLWPDYDRIRATLLQLARGLHAVHRHGKVHRDIKPPNVLVTPEGRVVLLDFGLVTEHTRDLLEPQPKPQLVGTPAYMSPEQALSLPGTAASDWYSVGVMLYQAICGELPFQGSLGQILTRKQIGKPPNPRDLMPDVPEDLEALCLGLLEPDAELRLTGREVFRRLEGAEVRLRRPRWVASSGSVYVGRDRIFEELNEAYAVSRRGAVTVLAKGPSGIGKTALLERFVAGIRERDAEVVILMGRCYPQESVPYKALDSLIDALSRFLFALSRQEVEVLLPCRVDALVRLFPVLLRVEAVSRAVEHDTKLEKVSPQTIRRRAFTALRELLSRLATRRPVVLVIDDLQWGDIDSFLLLDKLLELPDPPPVLFLGSYRRDDEATSPFLRALASALGTPSWQGRDVRQLPLTRLADDEVEELVERLEERGLLPQGLEEAVAEAEGHPLLITELVRYIESRRWSGEAPISPEEHGSLADLHLRDLIMARVARLEPDARRLLAVVSVAGRPLDLDVAREAAGLRVGGSQTVAQLRTFKLVRQRAVSGAMEIEVYHDRIRETMVEGLAGEEMRRLHRDLALALESSGRAEPETLAVHFQATEEVARAREYVTSAALRAEEALAFERAARLYRMALDLLPQDADPQSEQRYSLQVRLGSALANAGRSRDAAETYIQAVGDSGSTNPVEVQRRAAEKLLISGHIDRGLAVLRHVLRTLGMELKPRSWRSVMRLGWHRLRLRLRGFEFVERAEVECDPELLRRIDVCWSVEIGLFLVDVMYASEFHARHLLLALQAGEPQRIARGLAMEVFFGAMDRRGPRNRTGAAEDLARELAGQVEGAYAAGLTEMALGIRSCSEGHWAKAHVRLRNAEIHLLETRSGVAWELDTVHHFRVLALLGLGRLGDLFDELPHLLSRSRDRGDLYLEIHLLHWVESFRYLVADRPAAAREVLQETLHKWSYEGFHYQHFGHLHAEVQVALYCGRGEEAWELVNSRWRDLTRSMIQRIEMVLVQSLDLRARAALAAAAVYGDANGRERLLLQAEKDSLSIERCGSSWALGLARLLRAGVHTLHGQRAQAQEHLEVAITAFEVEQMTLHSAVARRRRMELYGGPEAELVRSDEVLRGFGVEVPERFVAVLAPGRFVL